jgi:hypothetical protein
METNGWGFYWVYDSARSNKIAHAVLFPSHQRLVLMTLGDEQDSETTVIDLPSAMTRQEIGSLLKQRFHTEYVTFHDFVRGEWV